MAVTFISRLSTTSPCRWRYMVSICSTLPRETCWLPSNPFWSSAPSSRWFSCPSGRAWVWPSWRRPTWSRPSWTVQALSPWNPVLSPPATRTSSSASKCCSRPSRCVMHSPIRWVPECRSGPRFDGAIYDFLWLDRGGISVFGLDSGFIRLR